MWAVQGSSRLGKRKVRSPTAMIRLLRSAAPISLQHHPRNPVTLPMHDRLALCKTPAQRVITKTQCSCIVHDKAVQKANTGSRKE